MGYGRGDYGPNPHDGANNNGAGTRGWGPGWPHCQGGKMSTARGGGVAVQVRTEVAPMVGVLLAATQDLGYTLHADQCGGFACRPIRGSSTPSNHSWGLAVDLNWNRNPMGLPFRSEIPPAVVNLWEQAGWYWGGRYRNRPDTMHFEYIGTPGSVAAVVAGLNGHGPVAAKPATPHIDGYAPGSRTIAKGDKGEDVAVLQRFLGIQSKGTFGNGTVVAVRRYQEMQGLAIDAVVGPRTWAPILAALKKGKSV